MTGLSQGFRFVTKFGSTIVLARLLTPEDFGLVAMAVVATGFIAIFKDAGLSTVTIQRQSIDQQGTSNLFWANVALGLGAMVCLMLLSPLVSWIYGDDRLTMVILAVSLTYPIGCLSIQHMALMRRQLQFGKILIITNVTAIAIAAITIVMAFANFGYWAIVYGMLLGPLVGTLMTAAMYPWVPSLPRRDTETGGALSFGADITGYQMLNYVSRNLDNFLIGAFCGPAALGLYSKAYGLMMMPLQQINGPASSVSVPMLSRLADQPERYRRAFHEIQELIAFTTLPTCVCLLLSSSSVITTVLGDEWSDATPIFAWLAVAGANQSLLTTTGWIMVSQGRSKDQLKWGGIASLIIAGSFLIGLPWGPVGVAAAYTASGLTVRTPLLLWWIGRRGIVDWSDYWKASRSGLVLSVLIVTAHYLLEWAWSFPNDWKQVASVATIAIIIATLMIATRQFRPIAIDHMLRPKLRHIFE